MTLKECYAAIGGDYNGVIKRLQKEDMVASFLKMFLKENFCEKLSNAIAAGEGNAAFCVVHTLKGNCMNLGFTKMQEISSGAANLLREGKIEEARPLLEDLMKEYRRTVETISRLDA